MVGRNAFFILCYLFLLISVCVCVCVFKWGWGGFSGIFVVLLGLVKLHLYGVRVLFLESLSHVMLDLLFTTIFDGVEPLSNRFFMQIL